MYKDRIKNPGPGNKIITAQQAAYLFNNNTVIGCKRRLRYLWIHFCKHNSCNTSLGQAIQKPAGYHCQCNIK